MGRRFHKNATMYSIIKDEVAAKLTMKMMTHGARRTIWDKEVNA